MDVLPFEKMDFWRYIYIINIRVLLQSPDLNSRFEKTKSFHFQDIDILRAVSAGRVPLNPSSTVITRSPDGQSDSHLRPSY